MMNVVMCTFAIVLLEMFTNSDHKRMFGKYDLIVPDKVSTGWRPTVKREYVRQQRRACAVDEKLLGSRFHNTAEV